MNTYIKNPVGELLAEINAQYIEDNIETLQDHFLKNDGWAVNKDNFERCFDVWLEGTDYQDLVKIINA